MEKLQNADIIMLLCRIQLFLFGCIFTAGGQLVKGHFKMHGKIERIKGRLDHCTRQKEETKKAKKRHNNGL